MTGYNDRDDDDAAFESRFEEVATLAARRAFSERLRRERDPLPIAERDPKTRALLREAARRKGAEEWLQEAEAEARAAPTHIADVLLPDGRTLRVWWLPEQRYISPHPPRPARYTYHLLRGQPRRWDHSRGAARAVLEAALEEA
jgi:hypothetical protein